MSDDRIRPCGCVVCVCEDEMQCHGCGAKACEAHDRIMNPLKYPSSPHALTREQCSLCTANRPRLCDQHYKQGADELLKHVTAAIQDQQTPGGVKATYEQLLELCNQQRQALAQQAQEIERLEGVCLDRLRSGQRLADENILLRQSLASMTAERDEAVDETTSLRASCHAFDLQVQELQATLAAREAKYQKTISESIDQIDLQCDEFNRIKAITDNEEIKGICDRAVRDIGQRVPVIQQRDAAVQDAARLREALEALWRMTEIYKITDLDAHAVISKALKGA